MIALATGSIVLRDLHGVIVAETGMNDAGHYRFSVAPGVYEIQVLDPSCYLSFRRAHVPLSPDYHSTVNLYPIASDCGSSRMRPDPQLAYDDYHPDEKNPDLDLLVQYKIRTATDEQVKYEGPLLMLSFDLLAIRASTLVLDTRTLKATAKDHAFVDLGQTRMKVQSVELSARERTIRVVTTEETRDIHF